MSKADTPAPSPELAPGRLFDSARLIAQVRAGDQAAVKEAYRYKFGDDLGRLILLHALAKIGQIGAVRGDGLIGESRAYHDGRGDAVLEITKLAGFDPVSIAASIMTNLMEQTDDRYDEGHPHHDHGPGIVFDDDGSEPVHRPDDEPEF